MKDKVETKGEKQRPMGKAPPLGGALRDIVRTGDSVTVTKDSLGRVIQKGMIGFDTHFMKISLAADWRMALGFWDRDKCDG